MTDRPTTKLRFLADVMLQPNDSYVVITESLKDGKEMEVGRVILRKNGMYRGTLDVYRGFTFDSGWLQDVVQAMKRSWKTWQLYTGNGDPSPCETGYDRVAEYESMTHAERMGFLTGLAHVGVKHAEPSVVINYGWSGPKEGE